MKPANNPDEILQNLLSLQADSLVLFAAYDEHDILRYANRSFRSAYTWSLMSS